MSTIRRTPKPAYEIREGKPLPQPLDELYRAFYESRISFDELSEKSGIHTETMRKWFSFGNMPTLFSYMSVANALGMGIKLEILK